MLILAIDTALDACAAGVLDTEAAALLDGHDGALLRLHALVRPPAREGVAPTVAVLAGAFRSEPTGSFDGRSAKCLERPTLYP